GGPHPLGIVRSVRPERGDIRALQVVAGNRMSKITVHARRLLEDSEVPRQRGKRIRDEGGAERCGAGAPDGGEDTDRFVRVQVRGGEIDSRKTVHLDVNKSRADKWQISAHRAGHGNRAYMFARYFHFRATKPGNISLHLHA